MKITRRELGSRTLGVAGAAAIAARASAGGTPPDPSAALAAMKGNVYSVGPHGEKPAPASAVDLTADEIATIKKMKATAAIVMHYTGNGWARGQIDGLKHQFGLIGIDVIAVTNANFSSTRQVSDIETVLERKPNIIVSIPVNAVSTASAYEAAAKQGVKLVFMDNVPKGMSANHGYISVVSADNYGNGMASALLMVQALNSHGTVGLVYYAADFFVTNERYRAAKKVFARYPGIKILEEQGIGGPNFSSEADRATSAILTAHPRVDGIWAIWDVPAEGVVSAARSANKSNLLVTNCDLGEPVAIDMAMRQFIVGIGSQRPYDQGVTEAKLAGYGLLGKTAPPFVALPALPVTRANLLHAWTVAYHKPPPKLLQKAMGS